ncbi:MAG: radical SAM protein [Verrucomicrobia bacterium]|nr:radical SAM protein [Verrucomicrobiota bacterium]
MAEGKKKVLLFNPRSAKWKHRIPNSILQVGASVHDQYDVIFVDGNMESDPWKTINGYLSKNDVDLFGCTVMPGPQLKQAIPFSKKIKEEYPKITIVWGGYFASNQHRVVLQSGYVDYVVNGPGDNTFPNLLQALDNGTDISAVKNLILKTREGITRTAKEELLDQDTLPELPYTHYNTFYPIEDYLQKTFLGNKTIGYHSSFGCPFTCSFCAVVPIYNARWKGKSSKNIYKDIKSLKEEYGIDSIEFHDNNFFTSRKRVVEFSHLVKDDGLKWWGEGRIDTLDKYKDEDLQLMKEAGCEMIFFGAETGSDEVLKQMDKGGTQTAAQIKEFAIRLKKFGIVPEYSFVLGMPGESEAKVMQQIDADIRFIKEIKTLNPSTEIIIYLYSPVPTEGSELYEQITSAGFQFPENLEDWLNPSWENFDLRKNPLTPWLTAEMVDKIKNFETVLNGYHPTKSDYRIRGYKKKVMRMASKWRYKTGFYHYPYEIKAMHKIWKYRQPEIEGFYGE